MSTVPAVGVTVNEFEKTGWKEYGIRLLFGGSVAAAVGIIGKAFGPVVAGLFLAFPAILPASLTMIAKHEGDRAAGVDAAGAALGSLGLVAFGGVVWFGASRYPGWAVLAAAAAIWFVVAAGAWVVFCRARHAG